MISVAVACSFLALIVAFLAIAFVIVQFGRMHEMMRAEFDDPTAYKVVTDGKFYRVRGRFDTFYTIRFSDREEARQYADQLAAWAYRRAEFDENKWRARRVSQDYAPIMEVIEVMLREVPVEKLRQDVMFGESMTGKLNLPALPSGRSFDQHTARARLFLDFIDELQKLEREEVEVAHAH